MADTKSEGNPMFPDDFLKEIPKTDLHVHLDGSMRITTLIDLAKEAGVELPGYTEKELRETVFKDSYASLEEYLKGFLYLNAVMQTHEQLERVAYEFACDNYDENVLYFECRFAPQLHANSELDIIGVIKAVNEGFDRAKKEYNSKPEVLSGQKPYFEYGIIVCAMRSFTAEFSQYYKTFCAVHKHESMERLYSLASMALVTAAVKARDEFGIAVVALDIAGAEDGFPAAQHKEAYDFAHKNFLCKTVHAGEGYGPESIFQAITLLHAQRIGHGFHLFHPDAIQKDDEDVDKEKYIQDLTEYVAANRVTMEVCLTSNTQTLPDVKENLAEHTFSKMLKGRLSVSLCTDNRLVSNTTVTKELRLATDVFDINAKQMKDIICNGFKRSFFPKPYTVKRAYVRRVINYYEDMERKYNILKLEAQHQVVRKDSCGAPL